MTQSIRSREFQYWEDSAANWGDRLARLKAENVDEVHAFIPWGLHETIQGIRDFSKASRLRLEKFLSLSHQTGLTVRLTIGFPAQKESFPSWTLALGDSAALVPSSLWKKSSDELALSRLPTIFEEALFVPFLEFVSDVFSLLSLYRFPEGPVVGVHLDWGIYRNDLGLTSQPSYAAALQERYPQASLIGLRYHCSFRDFSVATSPQGTRVLLDKRPWLLAYDYKYCRTRLLEERSQGILALRNGEPLLDLISLDPVPQSEPAPTDWCVAIDPTLLEGDAEKKAFPFVPSGLVHAQAVGVFRLWEYLKTQSAENETRLVTLREGAAPASTVSVVAGRFLPKALFHTIRSWVEAGTLVVFPLGQPQYDENLVSLDWKTPPRTLVRSVLGNFGRLGIGKGQVWFPDIPTQPVPEFWEQMHTFYEHVSQGAIGGEGV